MTMLDRITPLVLTQDEEANVERVLARLAWAREVVVVDGGSRDRTRELVARFSNARCVEHPFDSHAAQWNFALADTGIATDWVLALDADYVLTDALIAELESLAPDPEVAGYRVHFRYCVAGRPLRGTLYPPVVALYRREGARYVQDGHTQRVRVAGRIAALRAPILHDDRKPLARWIAAQARYAELEAEHLCNRRWRELGWPDRLRKLLVPMPPLAFVWCLTAGRGILDGWAGLHYATQRAVAEALLSLALIGRRLAAVLARGGSRGR